MGFKTMKNFSSLILISATLILASCKSKPSQAQWEGYSECTKKLLNSNIALGGGMPSPQYVAVKCKPIYDIPLTKEEKLKKKLMRW